VRLTHRLFLIVVFNLILIPYLNGADWPGFLGPDHNGSIRDGDFGALQGGLKIGWQRSLGSGYSGISISGERVITMFSDGTNDFAIAVNIKDGKELWRHEIGPTYKGHDGSHDGPLATPAIHANRIYGLSPGGKLFVLELATGKPLWSIDTVAEFHAKDPFYGFTASPLVAGDVVVVQTGGDQGRAVAGVDTRNGKVLWTAGDDSIAYQSPLMMKKGDRQVIIATGNAKLYAIEPRTGKLLLEYEHGGAGQSEIMVPTLVGDDQLLLRNKQDTSDLVRIVAAADGKLSVEKLWTAGVFKNSYSVPVYHDGYIYGYSSRVLQCVEVSTGQIKWRSRTPTDGFVMVVNNALVILTKDGKVYAGQASPDGWKEISKAEPFQKIAWTHPSFGDGSLFVRSHGEIARLDWSAAATSTTENPQAIHEKEKTRFSEFLAEVERSHNKSEIVDRFWSSIKSFPLVEWPDRVYFLYRGEGQDIAVYGDFLGQDEEPMRHISGTDVFYYETRLEPDASITYRYFKNFEEMISDPHNARKTTDRRGNPLSWMTMPAYREPSHLKTASAGRKGKMANFAFDSKSRPGASIKLDVYLPGGYDTTQDDFPVLYVFGGPEVQTIGALTNSVDNLIGNTIKPLIVVFLKEIITGENPIEDPAEELKAITGIVVNDIIPVVDTHYRTISEASGRAVMGAANHGNSALYLAFGFPDSIGGLATQSAFLQDNVLIPLRKMISDTQKPLRIYVDWGLYDYRSKTEGWDNGKESRLFYAFLREKGFRPAGGEVHEGTGWTNWRNRTDRLLAALFPVSE